MSSTNLIEGPCVSASTESQQPSPVTLHVNFAGNESWTRIQRIRPHTIPPILTSNSININNTLPVLSTRPQSAGGSGTSSCNNNKKNGCSNGTTSTTITTNTNTSSTNTSSNSSKRQSRKLPESKTKLLSPVDYLRGLMHGRSRHADSCSDLVPHRIYFKKPSEDEMAAYDLSVVNAIRSKDLSRLRALHEEGKSFNACNRFGESLLHMACRRGDLAVVTFLVDEVGVRLDVRDDYGRTALHDACWTTTPNFDVMDVLIHAFPSDMLLAEDVRGHTPFDYARKEHWVPWIEFLRERREIILQKRGHVKAIA